MIFEFVFWDDDAATLWRNGGQELDEKEMKRMEKKKKMGYRVKKMVKKMKKVDKKIGEKKKTKNNWR